MKKSQDLVEQAGIKPKLNLAEKTDKGVQGTGPHTVKLVSDRIVKGTEYETQKEIQEVEYTVEEDGVEKTYNVPVKDKLDKLHYLVQRLAQYNEGDIVVMEYKRKGIKGYIEVRKENEDTEEVPVVDADEVPYEEE